MKFKWNKQQPRRELRDPILGSPAGHSPKPHPLHTCETEEGFSANLVRLEGRTPVYQGTFFLNSEEVKSMEIHCNLRDSKTTVEEGISKLVAEQETQAA